MKTIRVIGDVHGEMTAYHRLVQDVNYSVQLGDMGFNYSSLKGLGNRHVFIPGNHDNYDALPTSALDSFGPVVLGPFNFFYVRGAWSIDVKRRKQIMAATGGQPRIWWPQEELTPEEMEQCLELYLEVKPDVVLSHSCPYFVGEIIGNPGVWSFFGFDGPRISRTQKLLEEMWYGHQPKLWLFGHFHKDKFHIAGDTMFQCVDSLNYFDFNEQWEIV